MLRGAERVWPPSGARAQRGRLSEAQRSGAKRRGRGLGQRNILEKDFIIFLLFQRIPWLWLRQQCPHLRP